MVHKVTLPLTGIGSLNQLLEQLALVVAVKVVEIVDDLVEFLGTGHRAEAAQ